MKTNAGRIQKGALIAGSGALLLGLTALAIWPRPPKISAAQSVVQTAASLSVFAAPSHVPADEEQWVLIGSLQPLPDDLVALPASAGVVVLETQKISKVAVGIRLTATAGV